MNTRRLYLASQSARRREILTQYRIPYTLTENLLVEESLPKEKTPDLRQRLRYLAREKALASKQHLSGLILGVDTIVVHNNKILVKPSDLAEAKAFLKMLSQDTHQVISAFSVHDTITNTTTSRSAVTQVTFHTVSDEEIDYYCTHFNVLDKAGAYGIQEYAGKFVSKIEGSFYNVVGLPIELLLSVLTKYELI